jgi:hypothetical protein
MFSTPLKIRTATFFFPGPAAGRASDAPIAKAMMAGKAVARLRNLMFEDLSGVLWSSVYSTRVRRLYDKEGANPASGRRSPSRKRRTRCGFYSRRSPQRCI